MGEARFNGMHARPAQHGLNAQAAPQHIQLTGAYGEPFSFTGTTELDDILSLQSQHILLAPDTHVSHHVNVAALVQYAVSQDPHGHSLNPATLTKLKHAPADPHEFGI